MTSNIKSQSNTHEGERDVKERQLKTILHWIPIFIILWLISSLLGYQPTPIHVSSEKVNSIIVYMRLPNDLDSGTRWSIAITTSRSMGFLYKQYDVECYTNPEVESYVKQYFLTGLPPVLDKKKKSELNSLCKDIESLADILYRNFLYLKEKLGENWDDMVNVVVPKMFGW